MDSKRGKRHQLAESCEVLADATEIGEKQLTVDDNQPT